MNVGPSQVATGLPSGGNFFDFTAIATGQTYVSPVVFALPPTYCFAWYTGSGNVLYDGGANTTLISIMGQ